MKDVGGAVLAASSPPFLGRERAAVDLFVEFFFGRMFFLFL